MKGRVSFDKLRMTFTFVMVSPSNHHPHLDPLPQEEGIIHPHPNPLPSRERGPTRWKPCRERKIRV
jgi:hypothetical protein